MSTTTAPAADTPPPAHLSRTPEGVAGIVRLHEIHIREDWNPRTSFDPTRLAELKSSIRALGVLAPITVRPSDDGVDEPYTLVDGERRLRVAVELELQQVPAMLDLRVEDELAIALTLGNENESLNPIETANGFARLRDEQGLTVRGIAEKVGVKPDLVTKRLQLLEIPEDAQVEIAAGDWSTQLAKPLAGMATVNPVLAQAAIAAEHAVPGAILRAHRGDPAAVRAIATHAGRDVFDVADDLPVDHLAGDQAARAREILDRTPWHRFRLGTNELEAARALGVLWPTDTDPQHPFGAVITDLEFVRGVAGDVVDRAHRHLAEQQREREQAQADATARHDAAAADRERQEQQRRDEQARRRAADLDTGRRLMTGLATAPLDVKVLRFLCARALLGYDETHHLAASLTAARAELQHEQTRDDGTVEIVMPHGSDACDAMWNWWSGANTPEEIAGRTLVILAVAERLEATEGALTTRVEEADQDEQFLRDGEQSVSWARTALGLLDELVAPHLPHQQRPRGSGRPAVGDVVALVLAHLAQHDDIQLEAAQLDAKLPARGGTADASRAQALVVALLQHAGRGLAELGETAPLGPFDAGGSRMGGLASRGRKDPHYATLAATIGGAA